MDVTLDFLVWLVKYRIWNQGDALIYFSGNHAGINGLRGGQPLYVLLYENAAEVLYEMNGRTSITKRGSL